MACAYDGAGWWWRWWCLIFVKVTFTMFFIYIPDEFAIYKLYTRRKHRPFVWLYLWPVGKYISPMTIKWLVAIHSHTKVSWKCFRDFVVWRNNDEQKSATKICGKQLRRSELCVKCVHLTKVATKNDAEDGLRNGYTSNACIGRRRVTEKNKI